MAHPLVHEIGPLSAILVAPLIGVMILLFVPDRFPKVIRWFGVIIAASVLYGVIHLGWIDHQAFSNLHYFQSQNFWPWIQSLGIQYHIGWDGLSFTLVLLVALMSLIAMGASFYIQQQVKALIISLLLLETTLVGAFVSLNLILFDVNLQAQSSLAA